MKAVCSLWTTNQALHLQEACLKYLWDYKIKYKNNYNHSYSQEVIIKWFLLIVLIVIAQKENSCIDIGPEETANNNPDIIGDNKERNNQCSNHDQWKQYQIQDAPARAAPFAALYRSWIAHHNERAHYKGNGRPASNTDAKKCQKQSQRKWRKQEHQQTQYYLFASWLIPQMILRQQVLLMYAWYSILPTLVMLFTPICLAKVTKFVRTPARNMIASLVFLDEHITIWASLPLFEVFLKVLIAGPLVPFKHALWAKFHLANVTFEGLLFANHAFAIFCRAKLQVGVINGLLPQFVLLVFINDFGRKRGEAQ